LKDFIKENSEIYEPFLNERYNIVNSTIISDIDLFDSYEKFMSVKKDFLGNSFEHVCGLFEKRKSFQYKKCTSQLYFFDNQSHLYKTCSEKLSFLRTNSPLFLVGGEGIGKTFIIKRLCYENAKLILSKFNNEMKRLGWNLENLINDNSDKQRLFFQTMPLISCFSSESILTPIFITLDKPSAFYLAHGKTSIESIICVFLLLFLNCFRS
jgi:hypothetical protein